MADVTIIRHKVSAPAAAGGAMPVADARIIAQQKITSSGSSQAFSNLTAVDENECWTVIVKGGDVTVKFGPNTPTAAVGDGWPLPAGTIKPFAVPKGWSAAVIDG